MKQFLPDSPSGRYLVTVRQWVAGLPTPVRIDLEPDIETMITVGTESGLTAHHARVIVGMVLRDQGYRYSPSTASYIKDDPQVKGLQKDVAHVIGYVREYVAGRGWPKYLHICDVREDLESRDIAYTGEQIQRRIAANALTHLGYQKSNAKCMTFIRTFDPEIPG